MRSFPDRKVEILNLVAEGDTVLVRTRVTGTNQGGFPAFGIPPNGKPIDIESWSIIGCGTGRWWSTRA
jgi:predicted ester cyclase